MIPRVHKPLNTLLFTPDNTHLPPLKKIILARKNWEIIQTFQCAEFKANGHSLFSSISSYFSALRQLALVKQ